MYFHKIDHPHNFIFGREHAALRDASLSLTSADLGEDVYRIGTEGPACSRWENPPCETDLHPEIFQQRASRSRLELDHTGALQIFAEEKLILKTRDGSSFGLCGSKWLFCFDLLPEQRFYGMGEKNNGFEKSGKRTKFWNTDVWSDFSDDEGLYGVTDPMYISVPYLLVNSGSGYWIGILVHNPYPVFMDTGARQVIEGVKDSGNGDAYFYLGSTNGAPELYLIVGSTPAEVTRKLQRLVGTVPRPPLWALGYHQSRWGYGSAADLEKLDQELSRHQVPCDALWLDIDYLDGYRIFTIDREKLPDFKTAAEAAGIAGRKIVPILDPGIKKDPGYAVYDEGVEEGVFCLTSEGKPYVGFVWPGASCFPDFSLEQTKSWWAKHTQKLAALGVGGFWIDMNDPSSGSAELGEMHFGNGKIPHEAYHNLYANGMAAATWRGVIAAYPDKRPFLLSRSGFIGINTVSAVWTGDNHSNYHHLRKAVEMQLSMSLSGIPFSGSDAGGFGSDAEPENFIDWFKTMFLFPFLRNHSADGTVFQEPWAFDESTLDIVRGYIRARYALRPYLYQLFIRQEAEGDPIIRPLLYHYADCDTMDDQFLVGDAVLQAPKLEKGLTQRSVFIPPGEWYESRSGEWISGPCSIAAEFDACGTPLYIRSGSVIPMSRHADVGDPLTDIDVFLCSGYLQTGRGEGTVTLDAGEGFEYRKGEKTEIAVSFEWSAEKQLSVVVEVVNAGWRLPRIRLLFPNSIESAELTLKHADGKRERINCQLQAESLPLPGCGVNLFAADIVQV